MTHTTARVAGVLGVSPRDDMAARATVRPGLLARAAAALRGSRQRRADAAVARFIQINGGAITDELERRISRDFGHIVGDR